MLQKVNIIGVKYVHIFRNEAGILEIECTKEEYDALGLPGAGAPDITPKGYEWVTSQGRNKYDTASGDLEDGQYADTNLCMVKVPGYNWLSVHSSEIIGGVLSADAEAQIKQTIRKEDARITNMEKVSLEARAEDIK